ncbi:MAG: hypothetical protein ACE5FK_07065, partial [Candidatus Methylomirabilia bacterium]
MRLVWLWVLASLLAGCSVISVDFTPRVRPLREKTVDGSGAAKILLVDLSGVLSAEPILSLGSARP